ncbi:MAG TPA: 7-cyano-7-deazaguanine synthase QueC [Candidatus Saccharimonadales bacterium]|nr:7-cyano-7-deazaguanine synthase QueC [Candidatus Saccharimonadales bacterium]
MKVVIVLSGGMDSATALYKVSNDAASSRSDDVHALSFDYGQRHVKELAFAARLCARLGVRHTVSALRIPLASALTDPEREIPLGHYTHVTMRQTVVPNRNAIMLAIAWGVAVSESAERVVAGMHAGDRPIYPDCRPEFVHALEHALRLGNEGFGDPALAFFTPFITMTKADIVREGSGYVLPVPYDLTWSCYLGRDLHCGRCGTCAERREAFALAGVPDPTEYEGDAR